jgi:hypothetical protein
MTVIEFRMFFESLPDDKEIVKGQDRPDKTLFAKECDIPLTYLKDMAIGKRSFTEAMVTKLLPVMRRHGFKGN